MDRAHKFLERLSDHALVLMESDIHKYGAKELDYIAAVCNLHNEICEFIELREKFDGKGPGMAGGLFGDSPHRRGR